MVNLKIACTFSRSLIKCKQICDIDHVSPLYKRSIEAQDALGTFSNLAALHESSGFCSTCGLNQIIAKGDKPDSVLKFNQS